MSQNTAILLFSRSAKAEANYKSFIGCSNNRLNRKLASGFIKNTVDAAIASNLPYYIIDEHKQHGDSFGGKLAHAVEDVFAKGYQNIIIVGSDCAQLTSAVIQKASIGLTTNDVVIGPDNHGGVYLIGLTKKLFNKVSFQQLPWQTAGLFEQLKEEYLLATTVELSALTDINNFEDLKSVQKLLSCGHKLKALITSIIASTYIRYLQACIHYCSYRFSLLPLRAPPTV